MMSEETVDQYVTQLAEELKKVGATVEQAQLALTAALRQEAALARRLKHALDDFDPKRKRYRELRAMLDVVLDPGRG